MEAAEAQLQAILDVFDESTAKKRLAELEHTSQASELWDDASQGQELLSNLNRVKVEIEEISRLKTLMEDSSFAVELLEASSDNDARDQEPIIEEAARLLQDLEASLGCVFVIRCGGSVWIDHATASEPPKTLLL